MHSEDPSSISDFISYGLAIPSLGIQSVTLNTKSITFAYPCTNQHICTPYILNISAGIYKFECWGAKGANWIYHINPVYVSKPGLGGYTSGIIHIRVSTTFYIYIGATGNFNSANISLGGRVSGGGATDFRTKFSENWFSYESIKSRIMVAGGGGGSEWARSIGGNGGGLMGGQSYSAKESLESDLYTQTCTGANQTHGGVCPNYTEKMIGYSSSFGISGLPSVSNDMGGCGGGGYYGGGSVDFAGAGSGGSSFISGYHGSNSIANYSEIVHTNSSYHYTGYYFNDGLMILGNTTMPLPDGNEGIWADFNGKFRITLVGTNIRITYPWMSLKSPLYLALFILICSE